MDLVVTVRGKTKYSILQALMNSSITQVLFLFDRANKDISMNFSQETKPIHLLKTTWLMIWADGSDFLLTTKRMRIIDSSENPSPVTGSEILEGKRWMIIYRGIDGEGGESFELKKDEWLDWSCNNLRED
ncbi:hypothetical protein RYX36_007111 [Vicia faba]